MQSNGMLRTTHECKLTVVQGDGEPILLLLFQDARQATSKFRRVRKTRPKDARSPPKSRSTRMPASQRRARHLLFRATAALATPFENDTTRPHDRRARLGSALRLTTIPPYSQ